MEVQQLSARILKPVDNGKQLFYPGCSIPGPSQLIAIRIVRISVSIRVCIRVSTRVSIRQ